MWVAEERGLFKKHGIEPEIIIIGGGAARVVSSLLAGEIQFAVGGGDAVVRAALRGADTVMAVSPLITGLQRIMVRPAIKAPADIRGKKIGVTRFGSASHWVLQAILKKWGMKSDDVQILQLGLLAGQLGEHGQRRHRRRRANDAVVLRRRRTRLPDARRPDDMDIHYLQNSIDTTRSYLRKPPQALRFVRGYCEGVALFPKAQKRGRRRHAKTPAHPVGAGKRLEVSRSSPTICWPQDSTTTYPMLHRERSTRRSISSPSTIRRRAAPTPSSLSTIVSSASSKLAASSRTSMRTNTDE